MVLAINIQLSTTGCDVIGYHRLDRQSLILQVTVAEIWTTMVSKLNMKTNTMPRFILDIKNFFKSNNHATASACLQKQSSAGLLQIDTSV